VTETRFLDRFEREETDPGRAEVLTQLARVHVFRAEYDAGERLLEQAEALGGRDPVVAARVSLERGRKLRLAGDVAASRPFFDEAFRLAIEAGSDFLAVGEHEAAIEAFERSLAVREDGGSESGQLAESRSLEREVTRCCLAKALSAAGAATRPG
jgi:hypothetical protein